MSNSNEKNNNRKSTRFIIAGMIVAIAITSLLGVFLSVPKKSSAYVMPTLEVESQPEIRSSIWRVIRYALEAASAVAWKKAYSYFLNKIAYDTAVALTSGGKGQKPLIITDFGEYMKEAADGAAGEYLDSASQEIFGESLCTFTPKVQIGITAGVASLLGSTREPKKADCPLTEIVANVERISKMSTSDLIDFQKSFNMEATEIGGFFTLRQKALQNAQEAYEEAKIEVEKSSFKGVEDTVTGEKLTPAELIEAQAEELLSSVRESENIFTGQPLADAISLFTNTLASRMFKMIFERGVVPSSVGLNSNIAGSGGIAAAKQYAMELAKPSFRVRGPIDILNTLASCPDEPTAKTINNCVIDGDFRAAVDQRLTVKEAIDLGYLKGDRTFGFDSTGQEPEYYNGYPYRSLVILRKYRIIPSTWETAALFIKNYVDPAENFGLEQLVDLYDDEPTPANGNNPFYHLIDPNWVLKAPDTFCKREGPGEKIISDQLLRTEDTDNSGIIDEDDEPQRLITRQDYCADERTCIDEDEDGSCRFYGYCTEEKAIWKFSGDSCESYENTCQSYKDSDNDVVSYLQSGINFDSCSYDNAGCSWYCTDQYDPEKTFNCSTEDYNISGNKVYLDSKASSCSKSDVGCKEFVNITAGTNIVANSSFEYFEGTSDDQGDPPNPAMADDFTAITDNISHWRWLNDGLVTYASGVLYDGTYSLLARDINAGDSLEYWINTGTSVQAKTFAASFYAQSDCDLNGISIAIGADYNGNGSFDGAENYVDPVEYPPTDIPAGGWHRVSATAKIDLPDPASNKNRIGFKMIFPNAVGCNLYIDSAQLELDEVTAYKNYKESNQVFLKDTGTNLVANSSFSIDNGTNYYPEYDNENPNYPAGFTSGYIDSRKIGNLEADGWINAGINDEWGFSNNYSGSGGYQDIPITPGVRYDVSSWIKGGGDNPLTTRCLDSNHNIIPDECNLNAGVGDPRTLIDEHTNWTWHNFGVESDNSSAEFIRIELSGGSKFDDVSLVRSDESLVCRSDEVGCEMFNPEEKGDKVPGIVTPEDYCPAEFNGCKSYKQMSLANGANNDDQFVPALPPGTGYYRQGQDPVYLMAQTGRQCSASGVGCEEYTNLDELALGGEGLEYYSYIRHCLKPDAALCSTYYRWEGDEERGFELVAESLKGGPAAAPELWPGYTCNCDPDDTACTLYYDVNGNNYYCEGAKTISCSDDCHPLRNTIDGTTYNAIPSQGTKCQSREAGCREFRGSTGYNIRQIVDENFEDGSADGWFEPDDVVISTESLRAGGLSAKVDSSPAVSHPMARDVSDLVEQDKTYLVEFWAKAVNGDTDLTASFHSDDASGPPDVEFTTVAGVINTANNSKWQRFVLGPAQFNREVFADELFVIDGTEPFYIDNINLWETKGNVYLIYNSYSNCEEEYLGCSLYFDSDDQEHYLMSFSGLCRPEKTGCEAMIDTQNSTNPLDSEINGQQTIADTVRPMVNNSRRYCQTEAKGCQKLGLPELDAEGRAVIFSDTYIKNDPDQYDTIVCTDQEVHCAQYDITGESSGTALFKNPNEQLCEYRTGVNVLGVIYDSWFKIGSNDFCPVEKYTCVGGGNAGQACFNGGTEDPVCPDIIIDPGPPAIWERPCQEYKGSPQPTKVCGPQQQERCVGGGARNGEFCNSLADISDPSTGCTDPATGATGFCTDLTEVCYGGYRAGQSCDSDAGLEDTTFGCADPDSDYDGYCAEKVCQTDDDCAGEMTCSEYWVGQCSEGSSGCNEFRDPQDPQTSLVSDFRICAGGANAGVVCTANEDCDSEKCVYQGCNSNCRLEYDDMGNFYKLDDTCAPFPNDTIDDTLLPGCQPYYYLKQSVDSGSCHGVVNPEEGCILLNDTSDGAGLIYDSDLTNALLDEENGSPVLCPPATSCIPDSNTILLVDRDRVCNQWLYCRTNFTTENSDGEIEKLCYDIGNCQEIGSAGQCNKPVGEGQCDNDPGRACRLDQDCEDNGVCVRPPTYQNPNVPVDPPDPPYAGDPEEEYLYRMVSKPHHPMDLTYSFDEVDKVKNLSGFSRAGISWGCSEDDSVCYRDGLCEDGDNDGGLCMRNSDCPNGTCIDDMCPGEENQCKVVHGYYPTASMQEIGFNLNLPNHDFESGVITPWDYRGTIDPANVKVIRDSEDSNNWVLSINDPPSPEDGVRLNLGVLVVPDTPYVINLKLKTEDTTIVKVQLCYNNDNPATCDIFGEISVSSYWRSYSLPVNSPLFVPDGISGNTYLSIVATESGNDIFIDDVILQSVLEKKSANKPIELPNDSRFEIRSCRLYTESDSLECSYIDEKNKIHPGWRGYCLERDPANPNYCLQWWPIDVIEGESGGGEIIGYSGDIPLYYCLQASLYEFRRPLIRSTGDCRTRFRYKCPAGYFGRTCDIHDKYNPDHCERWCIPYGLGIDGDDFCSGNKNQAWDATYHPDTLPGKWFPYDGMLESTGYYNQFGLGGVAEAMGIRCDVIGQVVDPTGENKAWTTRITGAYGEVWDIEYNKDTDRNPFGSLAPPDPNTKPGIIEINNPSTWDTDYTPDWGPPFVSGGGISTTDNFSGEVITTKNQPIYFLHDSIPSSIGGGYILHDDYTEFARAGNPYSCKHYTIAAHRFYSWFYDYTLRYPVALCDDLFPERYYEDEQFAGSVSMLPIPSGGLGLKRIERIFSDVYNVWIWGEGECEDVKFNMCTSDIDDPDYAYDELDCGTPGDTDECTSEDGICSGMICVGGEDDGLPCGCTGGGVCEPIYACDPGADPLCGLSACTGVGDECMTSRCNGEGPDEGELCNVMKNCPQENPNQSTCATFGGMTKCVSDEMPDICDCPGEGTCSSLDVCLDNQGGPTCNNDSDCNHYCGGDTGSGVVCESDDDCEDLAPPFDECDPVANMCSGIDQRCSQNTDRDCSLALACPNNFSCDINARCTYDDIEQCDCRGDAAFCADGICDDDPDSVCATGGEYTSQCGVDGPCNDVSICKLSEKQCSCDAGESCLLKERCSDDLSQDCGDTGCVDDAGLGACCDQVCVGGLNHGECCGGSSDCPADPEWPDSPAGVCVESVCAINPDTGDCGVNCRQPCGSDLACVGSGPGTCTTEEKICIGGDNHYAPCDGDGDCPDGECADNMCAGGIRSGAACDGPFDLPYTDGTQYCTGIVDPDYDPDQPQYWTDGGFVSDAYHDDFDTMDQCVIKNIAADLPRSDTRPATYPDDYCWVQPAVYTITVNGKTGDVNIPDSGGTVVLKYNSSVNQEQLGIRAFYIDWGDGIVTPKPSYPAEAPMSNPSGPYHIATHGYVWPDCAPPEGCKIRIWVQDNWGYTLSRPDPLNTGSGYCEGTMNACFSDSQCPGDVECWGVCRDSDPNENYTSCYTHDDCGGINAYCSGVFDGKVIVTE